MIDRKTIRTEVIAKINAVVGKKTDPNPVPDSDAGEGLLLWGDLGMGPIVRQAMSVPYTNISVHHGGLGVSMNDAGGCKKVGEAVDLVNNRANRKQKP